MKNKRLFPRLTLLLALLSVGLTGCLGQLGTSWAGLTVLGDAQHIAFAYENTLSIVDVANGEPIPLVDENGEPIIGDEGQTAGWQINGNDFDNAKFFVPPLQYQDDRLLVLTLDRRLMHVNADNGSLVEPPSEPIGDRGNAVTPLVSAGDFLLVGLQERLVALDREGLSPVWSIETAHGVWSEPLVVDETVYFTSLDHSLYAVELATGDVIWSLDLGGAAAGSPTYDQNEDVFFIGTFESQVLKISRAGDILATYETEEWVWGAPVLMDNTLFVADLAGYVYRLDAESLTLDDGWKVQVAEGAIRTPPLVFDDYVVVGSRDEHVYWIDRDNGAVIFDRRLDGEILSDILYFPENEQTELEESLIVVSTLSNRESLVAFGATNGERRWTYRR